MSPLIRHLPPGNLLRPICNAGTAQNLKKNKVSLLLPNRQSCLWQGDFSRKNSYEYNCTEKKDFYQEDPQGKDFQGKAKGTNVCQKI